jgi:hypothetical protein
VRDAAKVAEYEAEYVPLKPGDMTRAILALLTEKDDEWEETLQIASNAADEDYHS